MKKTEFFINATPAVSYGEKTDKGLLFVHGLSGNKFEAEFVAESAVTKGWQVIGIDLPEHGGRTDGVKFVPWETIPEFNEVKSFMVKNYSHIAVMAVSIGAYMSLLAFNETDFAEKCLLVSPVVDMENIILGMMKADGITDERLYEEAEIPASSGQILSWKYLCYARVNPVKAFCADTSILYGENDMLIPHNIITDFAEKNKCRLTVMEGAEHWFHTETQLDFMRKWLDKSL